MITTLDLREPIATDYLTAFIDFIRSFVGWWYGDIPLYLLSLLKRVVEYLLDRTSFKTIAANFFNPIRSDYDPLASIIGILIRVVYFPLAGLFILLVIVGMFALLLAQLSVLPVIIGLILINPFLTP